MHPLMAPVLLRPAGLDALVHDAQLHPAKRQLRQTQLANSCERSPVICPDTQWHAVLTHGRFADCSYLIEIHPRDRLTADQVSAMSIRDGERIAPRSVACTEVAFEVHAPELIRCCDFGERFRVWRCAPLLPLWTGEAGSSENVAEGACSRQIHLGIEHFQSRLELTCSPR